MPVIASDLGGVFEHRSLWKRSVLPQRTLNKMLTQLNKITMFDKPI